MTDRFAREYPQARGGLGAARPALRARLIDLIAAVRRLQLGENLQGAMSRLCKQTHNALSMFFTVLFVVLCAGGGIALILFSLYGIITFEAQDLAWGTPSGPPVSAREQWVDIAFFAALMIALGLAMVAVSIMLAWNFIDRRRK